MLFLCLLLRSTVSRVKDLGAAISWFARWTGGHRHKGQAEGKEAATQGSLGGESLLD